MQPTGVQREEFWKSHILEWRRSSTDIREYCQAQEISRHTFYYWRKKILLSGALKKSNLPSVSAFVPITVDREKKLSVSLDSLRDPKWLGQFAAELIRGLR